jgi:hypothetical protein
MDIPTTDSEFWQTFVEFFVFAIDLPVYSPPGNRPELDYEISGAE